jgi:pimeloyl-ACP methyl ester carboxylesterase
MADFQHRAIEAGGLDMHVVEHGEGPLVVLLHGFPESWYSWRRQLVALADAGFRAAAPDQRGYGGTERPEDIGRYTMLHLVGDVVGLLDALGEEQAVVVGHDWGAPVAWHTALLRPDRVRGVVGLSVPFVPRGPVPPLAALREAMGERFYQIYFQEPGVAEAELEADVGRTMRTLLAGAGGEQGDASAEAGVVPEGGGLLDALEEPRELPPWLPQEDLDFYVAEFERTGFTGGLNWYRNIDRSWELLAPWQGATVQPPALYMAGDRDLVVGFPGMDQLIPNLERFVPNLRDSVMLPGCGHWTQQERAEEVNERLIEFCRGL